MKNLSEAHKDATSPSTSASEESDTTGLFSGMTISAMPDPSAETVAKGTDNTDSETADLVDVTACVEHTKAQESLLDFPVLGT